MVVRKNLREADSIFLLPVAAAAAVNKATQVSTVMVVRVEFLTA
jgi:hypothetical protein